MNELPFFTCFYLHRTFSCKVMSIRSNRGGTVSRRYDGEGW